MGQIQHYFIPNDITLTPGHREVEFLPNPLLRLSLPDWPGQPGQAVLV